MNANLDIFSDYMSDFLSRVTSLFVDVKRHPRLASYAARHRGCAQIFFHTGTWLFCLIVTALCAWTYFIGGGASNYPLVLLAFSTFLAVLVGVIGEWALLTSRSIESYVYLVCFYGSWVAMIWSSAMCGADAIRVSF
jgi:hypothetical protein